jgi:CrcB protein
MTTGGGVRPASEPSTAASGNRTRGTDTRSADTRGAPAPGTGPFATVRHRLPRFEPTILAVIFAGGVVGGLTRYAVTKAWPAPAAGFPWAVFTVNTAGAFALGLLLALLAELAPRRLLRPLLGTGFLGAFTTFSSVVTTTDQLLAHGRTGTAVAYLGGGMLAALGAVSFGVVLGRAIGTTHFRRPRSA